MVPRLLPFGVRSAIVSETRTRVLDEVASVAERFISEGFPVFLVGGIVRDLELGAGIDELDFDLTTPAHPDQIRRIVDPVADAVWTQGERFGTIGCMIGGREYEITTHRAEWYSDASRKPDVAFGDDIAADLSRRDFTVNAMAVELPTGSLIDPFGGRADLQERRLATPIAPEVSFADDPLRILRAARFIARYDLEPTAELVAAAAGLVGRMEIVSAERIRIELDKLLMADRPSRGLGFLAEIDAITHVLTHLDDGRLDAVGRQLDSSEPELEIRRLILFAPFSPAERADQISALRYSNEQQRSLVTVLSALDEIRVEREWSDEAVRRLVARVGSERLDTLFTTTRAVGGSAAAEAAFTALADREDLSTLDPVLGGSDVMDALGLTEGPRIGVVLDALRERRLREGPATREQELTFIAGLPDGDESLAGG